MNTTNTITPAEDRNQNRFDTVLEFTLKRLKDDSAYTIESAQGEILQAVDRLVFDLAFDMSKASAQSLGIGLLNIYENAHYPGKAIDPIFDRLANILVDAAKTQLEWKATKDEVTGIVNWERVAKVKES